MFRTECEYISGKGSSCADEVISQTQSQTRSFTINGTLLLVLTVLAISVFLIYILAKYAYQVATRTGRSRVGFVWLSIFFPVFTWGLCLILDKNDNRYSESEREKHKLKTTH